MQDAGRTVDLRSHTLRALALGLAATLLLLGGDSIAQPGSVNLEIARPADLDTWPNIGATVHMSAGGMDSGVDAAHGSAPAQVRQVQMAPADFSSFLATHRYPDGAVFAVRFYSVAQSPTTEADTYGLNEETFFAMEVIDRNHVDGRRFYVFPGGAARAQPLPTGNACAVCHNANGSFDGTFAQFYPTIRREAAH